MRQSKTAYEVSIDGPGDDGMYWTVDLPLRAASNMTEARFLAAHAVREHLAGDTDPAMSARLEDTDLLMVAGDLRGINTTNGGHCVIAAEEINVPVGREAPAGCLALAEAVVKSARIYGEVAVRYLDEDKPHEALDIATQYVEIAARTLTPEQVWEARLPQAALDEVAELLDKSTGLDLRRFYDGFSLGEQAAGLAAERLGLTDPATEAPDPLGPSPSRPSHATLSMG